MEYGCLCQIYDPANTYQEIPDPVASPYTAPADRIPPVQMEIRGTRPGTPSAGLRMYERPVTMESGNAIATDLLNWFPRSVAEQYIRWVPIKYTNVGGPAMTAPGAPGWSALADPNTPDGRLLVNEKLGSIFSISDTMTKPAQQLLRYNYASVDTESIVSRAKKSVSRALYGGGK